MTKTALAGLLLASSTVSLLGQPRPKTQAELTALQAMFTATDPDAQIKAAQDVLANFANTEFKSLALYTIAIDYSRKNDIPKMVAYGEQSLEADPKNYQTMLMMAQNIASHVRENDLDRDKQLADSEKYADQALATIKTAPKMNAQMTDAQWAAAQKDFTADGHQALGIIAMQRKKYDVAITEFKMSVDGAATPDPATTVRLGQAYSKAGKYDEAIPLFDKVMADANAQPAVKQYAQAERVRAMTAKAAAK